MFDHERGEYVPGFLRNLKLFELSGCGRGANQHARVVLVKADGTPVQKKYASVDELPSAIKNNLPSDAQSVFMRVANAQLDKNPKDDATAMKIAWTAVKNGWKKVGDKWVKKTTVVAEPGDAGAAVAKTLYGDTVKIVQPATRFIDCMVKAYYGPVSAADGQKGAQAFNDLIAQREDAQRENEINEEVWPLFCALEDSIRSIIADDSVPGDAKMFAVRQSVEQFMIAMADAVPSALADAELEKLLKAIPALAGYYESGESGSPPSLTRKDNDMADDTKKVADLESQIAALTKQVGDLTKQFEDANKKLGETATAKSAVDKELADLKKDAEVAKTDEVVKMTDPVDATKTIELRKSQVGEGAFTFMKAQQVRLEKAEQERIEVVFGKRAETEIGSLPGESIMKGKVLKAVEEIADEKVREAAIAALKAGNAAMKSKVFKTVGHDGGNANESDPEAKLDVMAKDYASKNSMPFQKAYAVVLETPEGRELYKQTIEKSAA
jgi:cation transport regulator